MLTINKTNSKFTVSKQSFRLTISLFLYSFCMSLLFDRYLEKERSKTKRDEKRREKQITENLCSFGRMAGTGGDCLSAIDLATATTTPSQSLSSRCHETILSTSPPYLSLFLSGYSLRLFPLLRAFARLFSPATHRINFFSTREECKTEWLSQETRDSIGNFLYRYRWYSLRSLHFKP